jgi:hypothetical protein
MQQRSLNRPAIGLANNSDLASRPIANNMDCGLRAKKERSLRRIACYALLNVTILLLLTPIRGASETASSSINLLDPKNGGQVVVATKDVWSQTILVNKGHGQEFSEADWVVYAFKDELPATFDVFTVLIPGADRNVKEFELLAGNDSPTGEFTSIGQFKTTNAKVIKSPYQEFKFPPLTAKYLKVRLLSGWVDPPFPYQHYTITIYQFQLFGRLKE